ncbi:glycosyltransferase family 2 protein [Pseudomonas putida]|uniref:Glycosyl transferase n=1 Tax=Pseudomonas putida TaxID=303 RepID=A0A6S5TSM0_PSEPU|nr:glycosyltransferase family 2 protein [Pseudomonas putida]BBT38415.1 glycosyl transferase [Pseudomonas putida]
MTGLAAAILGALALLVLLPTLVLFIEVLMACLPARLPPAARVPRPRLAVLVPAHDEASIIIATLDSIRAQLCEGDRLLVVADNCTDDTAALARAAGAEVVERFDAQARGKGYALDFGVRYLGFDPPPVIVVVDADCQLGEGALTRLATCCIDSGRPVQALYLMQAPEGAGLKTRVAEFAWRVKNLVRPRGWARLGLPCQLMGAGMAFTWRDLASLELASGHLVEDLKMGLDLCRIGKAPLFCPDARVTSWFPVSNEGLGAQRRRWEHGHLGVLLKDAPRLLIESLARRNGALLALALDLMVPPLALLVLALAGVFCLSWLVWLLLDVSTAPWLASCAVVLLGIAVLLAWYRFCRGLIAFSVLLYAPLYAAKKIPIYLGFLVKRQVDWVRSKRDGN